MRASIFAVGLCVVASSVAGGTQDDVVTRSSGHIALANGCVYAPSLQGGSWSLLYRQSGAATHCALTIKVQSQGAVKAQSQQGSGRSLSSEYVVGAFR